MIKLPRTVGASMIREPKTLKGRSNGYKALITATRVLAPRNPVGTIKKRKR